MITQADMGPVPVPEALLGRFNTSLLRLRSALLAIDEDQPVGRSDDECIVDVLRQTDLVQMLEGLYLFAVAGAQGAGKTTLIREIYGLDTGLLEGNLGQGERMPVGIRERVGVVEPRLWIRRLEKVVDKPADEAGARLGGAQIEEVGVEPLEWTAATRGGDSRALVVGMDVPASFFGVDGAGFLLLPGYEIESDSNRPWQQRMRGALVASPAAIVVTDTHLMASSSHQKVIADLQSVSKLAVRPLVAVTHTENIRDEERREGLRKRALEVFGSSVNVQDVVLTGVGVEYRATWADELRSRLNIDRCTPAELRAQQLEHLKSLISDELTPVLDHARTILERDRPTENEYQQWVGDFAEARKRAEADYGKAIDAILAHQQQGALAGLDEWLRVNGGWLGLASSFKEWAQLRSSEADHRKQKEVLAIWNAQAANTSATRLSETLRVEKRIAGRAFSSYDPARADGELTRTTNSETRGILDFEVPADIQRDMLFIAGREVEPSERLNAALRLLPVAALEYVRFSVQYATGVDDVAPMAGGPKQIDALLGSVGSTSRIFIASVVGILGVDAAVDGTLGSIPGLAAALQPLINGPAVLTVPAAGLIATVLASALIAGAGAAAVIAVANKSASRSRGRAYALMDAAYEQTRAQYVDQFADLLDALEDRIDVRMREYLLVDEAGAKRLTLTRAVAVYESARAHLLGAIGADRTVG